MAKKNQTPSANTASVDELLEVAPGQPSEEQKAALKAQIEELKAKERELKAALKGEKPKKVRELKGQMVSFQNKAGETITGLGVLYYVARSGGKLHYKEASMVHIMTEDEVAAYEAEQKALVS